MAILLTIFSILLFFCMGCDRQSAVTDFPEIAERGELIAITSYSPFSYFVYRGEVMGYEYELLRLFEAHIGLPVTIKLARDFGDMVDMLDRGEGDLIAYGLTVTSARRQSVAFTEPFNVTRQVLVQRKPENWRQMMLHQVEQQLIRNPVELDGETIVVRRGSAYVERLRNLSSEIGAEIHVEEAPKGVITQELIHQVASKEIDFTVADENIALIKAAFYQDLDASTAVSLPQQTAWAVRHSSVALLDSLNAWLSGIQKHAEYYIIYNKYFEKRRAFRTRYASQYFPFGGGHISPYDTLLREKASLIDWDWRLLAALMYRESRFDPAAESWAGAAGLMQLMPATAMEFGATDPWDPLQNIAAGVRYIHWLQDYWQKFIPDAHERKQFVLASYNVGQGHVQDARRLARAHGDDADRWHGHVAQYMLKKSNPEYYNREEVRFGYASGIEPVKYVESINKLYAHYQLFFD